MDTNHNEITNDNEVRCSTNTHKMNFGTRILHKLFYAREKPYIVYYIYIVTYNLKIHGYQDSQHHIFDRLENMPVLPSHPGLCGTACPYRCDDPLSFAEIEFRLPGGATHTHCFTARTTIHQVKEYVQANLELPFGDFTLSTVSPQFIFTTEHFSTTLGGFGLVPQSVLLVRPNMQVRSTTFTAAVSIMGSVIQVLMYLMSTIIIYLYENTIKHFCH